MRSPAAPSIHDRHSSRSAHASASKSKTLRATQISTQFSKAATQLSSKLTPTELSIQLHDARLFNAIAEFFALLGQFQYRDAAGTLGRHVQAGFVWRISFPALLYLCGLESAYYSMIYLQTNYHTRGSDCSLSDLYRSFAEEMYAVLAILGQFRSSLGQRHEQLNQFMQLLQESCSFAKIRASLTDAYIKLSTTQKTTSDQPAFDYAGFAMRLKGGVQSTINHPWLQPLKANILSEVNSLRLAFLAQDTIAECRFHISLIHLHQMSASLLDWAQRCGGRRTENESGASSGNGSGTSSGNGSGRGSGNGSSESSRSESNSVSNAATTGSTSKSARITRRHATTAMVMDTYYLSPPQARMQLSGYGGSKTQIAFVSTGHNSSNSSTVLYPAPSMSSSPMDGSAVYLQQFMPSAFLDVLVSSRLQM
jgi:hypothetical protein